MKRVTIFIGLVLFLLLFAIEQNCPAQTDKPIELKFSHFMPTMHRHHPDVFLPFAREVEEKSNGRVKITIYPAEVLCKAKDHYDVVASGIADFAFFIQSYTPGRFPLSSVVELPFLIQSSKVGSSVAWELARKGYFKEEYSGVKLLSLWTSGPGQIFMTKKRAKTLDDIKAMRLRSPGPHQTTMMRELGISPLAIPMPEVYDALQRGMMDGTIAPLSTVADFKLHEVINHYTIANLYVMVMGVAVNQKTWDTLTPDLQKIIEEASGAKMSAAAAGSLEKTDEKGLEEGKKAGGQVYYLPPEERKNWIERTKKINDKWVLDMEAKGLPGKKLFEETNNLVQQFSN